MKRREFLTSAAAVAGASALPARAWATPPRQDDPRSRLAIMSWGFDKVLRKPDDPNNPARTLEVMDIPQMFVERYGVRNVEMQHSHFASTEPDYLTAFRERVERAGSRVTQINLEFGNLSISSPNNTHKVQAIDLTKRWVDHAVMLGCPRVMINQGSLEPEALTAAAEALRLMGRYGDLRGVWVTAENRGANWQALADVVRAAGTYTTPDIGNFPDQESQHRGLRALFPMIRGNAHAKLRPDRFDFAAALRLMEDELGYTGLYSIEADPPPEEPYAAVQEIIDAVLAGI